MSCHLTKAIEAPPSTRQELLDFARGEFEQHRHVTDLVSVINRYWMCMATDRHMKGHIRYLISVSSIPPSLAPALLT
jgi:hypothetical protein